MNKQIPSLHNFEEEHSEAQSTAACYPSYTSFESGSPQFSGSPYPDTDSLSGESKKIRKKRNTYQKIDDDTRILLLEAVKQGDTLKAAAKRYNINYSSAKSILHTYRKEGRILKKSAQERTARKRTKSSQNLEMSPIYLCQQQEDFLGNGESPFQSYYQEPKYQPNKHHQYQYDLPNNNNEEARNGMNSMGINTFGGYLKVNNPQTQQNGENGNGLKNPASTLVLRLESQPLYGQSHNEVKNVGNKNWQLNVNVHSDGLEKGQGQRSYNYHHQGDTKMASTGPEKFVVHDPIYMNPSTYSNSPLFRQGLIQREDQNYNPGIVQTGYSHYDPMNAMNHHPTEVYNLPPQEQGYDVSCYLNSSPTYPFPQHKGPEIGSVQHHHHHHVDNFGSNLKGLMLEPQEALYDGSGKGAYHYYKPNAGMVSSLKSY